MKFHGTGSFTISTAGLNTSLHRFTLLIERDNAATGPTSKSERCDHLAGTQTEGNQI